MKEGSVKETGRFHRKNFLLLLAAVLILSALSYATVFAPKLSAVRRLRGEAAAANEELRNALSAWEEIARSSQGDVERLERLALTWRDRVPEAPETERLMEELVGQAARHNLRSLRIEISEEGSAERSGTVSGPGGLEPEEAKPVEELPLRVTFVSTYRDMAGFLDAIPRLTRLASVRSVAIRRTEGRMETRLEISAFYRRPR